MIKDDIIQIEKYAKDNNVPIMLPEGIDFLLNYINMLSFLFVFPKLM